jgi:hydroxymethylpyrimidine/phosphomethylpyrimidine kinase
MISPEQQRADVLSRLSQAVTLLEESMDFRLAAGAPANIGYAIRGARDNTGVASVSGGLLVQDTRVRAAGSCGFGADGEMARVVLSAMKFDPEMRCAATIRYAARIQHVLEDMFLECCTVDRSKQAPGVSTMDWGIASCCRDGVPEAVIDPGAAQKKAAIHLFGETPGDVAGNIIMLSNRIIRIEL